MFLEGTEFWNMIALKWKICEIIKNLLKLIRSNLLSIVGILVLWIFWFIVISQVLMGTDFERNEHIGITLLLLILFTPFIFSRLLNFRRGIIIGFLGAFIPIIIDFLFNHSQRLNYFYRVTLTNILIMIVSISINFIILIDKNTRQEEFEIIKGLYTKKLKNIKNLFIRYNNFKREHQDLNTLILSIIGSLIVALILYIIN